jgi:hypothetical protein
MSASTENYGRRETSTHENERASERERERERESVCVCVYESGKTGNCTGRRPLSALHIVRPASSSLPPAAIRAGVVAVKARHTLSFIFLSACSHCRHVLRTRVADRQPGAKGLRVLARSWTAWSGWKRASRRQHRAHCSRSVRVSKRTAEQHAQCEQKNSETDTLDMVAPQKRRCCRPMSG